METIKFSLNFNSTESILNIKGIGDDIFLNYEGDIDFTAFVEELLYKIDEQVLIEMDPIDTALLHQKEMLIYETIVKIIESYNKSYEKTGADKTEYDLF